MSKASLVSAAAVLVFAIATPTGVWAGQASYTYDALGRLTKVDYGDGKTVTYTYDRAGNRTSSLSSGFPPGKVIVLPLLGGLVLPIS